MKPFIVCEEGLYLLILTPHLRIYVDEAYLDDLEAEIFRYRAKQGIRCASPLAIV